MTRPVAESAEEIHPLLTGMKVPRISGVTNTDGTPFDLNAAIAEKPVPAVYVLDTEGMIQFEYIKPTSRVRLDADILRAVEKAAMK